MIRSKNTALLLFGAFFVHACAVMAPSPEKVARRAVTPAMALEQPAAHQGEEVEWGGVLIAAHNRRDHTLLEILAYPLKADGRPGRGSPPLGRFLAVRAGYLETVEFAPGRLVTVGGPITGIRRGRIGERAHNYPTVDARQLHLWPQDAAGTEPRTHFGIGVGGSGWAVGVGF